MTTYYTDQLKQLTGENLKVQFLDDSGKTKWLNINLDSIAAIVSFLDNKQKIIVETIPGSGGHERWKKHQIGLAIAALTGIERNRDNDTRFNTPVGDKTPIGLYETVKELLADNPDNPRYKELFR